MQFFKALFVLVRPRLSVCIHGADAQARFGAQGAEGTPNRRQQWLVPSPDPDLAAHALLFRPPGDGPFPLALIAHASTQNVLRRAQMPQPEYPALAAWLVARGYAVLVPERPGHGATGGKYLEDQGGCDDANYSRAGYATADSIKAALSYLQRRNFYPPGRRGHYRALRRRLGRAGAGRRRPEGDLRDHRVRAGTRRPCQ